ncbi:MAG: hypothetical protein NTX50_06040 [Candidatus Sumerlaeota bacterium]|nr:hypothetical protein [Candidatus Sumerlaeota bacterium]
MFRHSPALPILWTHLVLAAIFSSCGKSSPPSASAPDPVSAPVPVPTVALADVPGFYLAECGPSCYEIARGGDGSWSLQGPPYVSMSSWTVTVESNALTFTVVGDYTSPSAWSDGCYYGYQFCFLPSKTGADDWDLVSEISFRVGDKGGTWYTRQCLYDPPAARYLHKTTDSQIVEYSRLIEMIAPASTRTLDIARLRSLADGLLARSPGDPYARIIYLDSLCRARKTSELEARIKEWRGDFANCSALAPKFKFRETEEALRALQLSATGRNAFDFIEHIVSEQTDLSTRLRDFPQLMDYEDYASGRKPLQNPEHGHIGNSGQIATKISGVISAFWMIEGRRTDALRLLAANYRMGQFMNQHGNLINRLIGIALRSIASRWLEIFCLNSVETPEECGQMWDMLERLNSLERDVNAEEMFAMQWMGRNRFGNFDSCEADTRRRVADVRFRNLRVAAAARWKQLSAGALPRAASDIRSLFPNGLPPDPFATSEPLRTICRPDQFVVYSVGPNGRDEGATITYDPTNGTLSAGDIATRVPFARQYPFQRGGLHASSADDIRRQFPNGLPPDPFASTYGNPLQITDDSGGLLIKSFGPDMDENNRESKGNDYRRNIFYDPTNGTYSEGDLWILIPR